MSVPRLPSSFIALLVMGSGCLAGDETQEDGDAPMWSVPEWRTGDWWQYAGSDGITYTHRVEARETKQGFEVYRVRIDLSEPDDAGATRHTFWHEVNSLGWVVGQVGEFTYVGDCANDPWFPLLERTDWQCNMTGSHPSGGLDRFTMNWTKVPLGWEDVATPAGEFQTFKLDFIDNNEGRSQGRTWYSGHVRNRVQEEAGDLVFRLEAWGTNAPNA